MKVINFLFILLIVKVHSESKTFECDLSTFIIDEEELWTGNGGAINRPQCYLTGLDIKKEDDVTLQVLDNNGNLKLETILAIHNSELEIIPDQFLEALPNLNIFEMISCNFKNFDRNFLKNMKNLRKLDFIESNIKKLEDFTFENLSNLTHLYFHVNPIEEIEENAFVGLENLKLLDIDYCHLTHLKENTFTSLKNLERLYLTSSQLKFLDFNLAANQNLKVIIFMSNEICFIKEKFFDNLRNLEIIDLGNNTCVDTTIQDFQRNPKQLQENLKNCFQNFECLLNCDSKLETDQYSTIRKLYCKISNDNLELSENLAETLKSNSKDLEEIISKHSKHFQHKIESLKKFDHSFSGNFSEILEKFGEIQKSYNSLDEKSENFSKILQSINENIKYLGTNYSNLSSEHQKLVTKNLTTTKSEVLDESKGNFNILFSGILIEFIMLVILFGLVVNLIVKPHNQVEEYTELTTRKFRIS